MIAIDLFCCCRLAVSSGSLLLATRPVSGHINNWLNGLTLAASLWLAMKVWWSGSWLSPEALFHVDAFNVHLIVLTAFVGFTTGIFSGP